MTDTNLLNALRSLQIDQFTTGPNWRACHDLCQSNEGEKDYDLVHALVHLIERDTKNANYWYKSAGQFQRYDDLKEEWQRILDVLEA